MIDLKSLNKTNVNSFKGMVLAHVGVEGGLRVVVFSCPASRDHKACNHQDQVGRGLCLEPHEAAPPFAILGVSLWCVVRFDLI